MPSCVDTIPVLCEHLRVRDDSPAGLPHCDQDRVASSRNIEIARNEGGDEGVLEVVSETGDFTSRYHLDACNRVRFVKSREGELGRLYPKARGRSLAIRNLFAHYCLGRKIHEVRSRHL